MSDRCDWAGPDPIYLAYHDTEWGVPEWDSRALWEKLILDGFQAGLSWITILKKRDNFRAAFQGFDPHVIAEWGADDVARLLADPGIIRHRGKIEATIRNARAWQRIEAREGFDPAVIAAWGERDVARLLQNPGIIRHRGKIEATITNARAYLEIDDFAAYCWNWVGGAPIQNQFAKMSEVPPSTALSTAFSKDLKKRGFKFCGPTIVYAWMEACGLVNDHLVTCPRHAAVRAMG